MTSTYSMIIRFSVLDDGQEIRAKNEWLNSIKCDMGTTGVCVNNVGDRVKWNLRAMKTLPNLK